MERICRCAWVHLTVDVMGFAITWIAVKRKSAAEVLRELQLKPTGEQQEFPEAPIAGAALPSGWYLVALNEYGHPLATEKSLARLSRDAEVVAVAIEEHVMVGGAEYWRDGQRRWGVMHDAQQAIEHLLVDGVPPPEFHRIREAAFAAQAAEGAAPEADHIFDVPLELAAQLTGYRHDKITEVAFDVLESASPPTGGLRRWFS